MSTTNDKSCNLRLARLPPHEVELVMGYKNRLLK
uniref:Uncharacterized protein n=1 Tax=Anguilla anguilla TaxID=7936 RepID=A0A0E9PUA4_ANGAN